MRSVSRLHNMDTSANYRMTSWLEQCIKSMSDEHFVSLSDGINGEFFDIPENISEPLLQQKRLSGLKPEGETTIQGLYLDNVSGAELLPSEEWVSFLTSLLSYLSSLRTIHIACDSILYSAVCIAVGNFLSTSSSLESLLFSTSFLLSYPALRALSKGLVETKCLRSLYINDRGRDLAPVLTNAFTGDSQNTSLQHVTFGDEGGEYVVVLPVLLSSSSLNLKAINIQLTFGRVTRSITDAFQTFAERLQYPLDERRKVKLKVTYRGVKYGGKLKYTEEDGKRIFKCLNFWMNAGKYIPTQTALVWNGPISTEEGNERHSDDAETWFLRAVNEHKNLEGLQLDLSWSGSRDSAVREHSMDHFFFLFSESIQSNESVESLDIHYYGGKESLDRKCWTHLFRCLRHKRRLKKLRLDDERAGDECFRSLMNLLQENIYLEEVVGPSAWRSEGKDALVKEALRRNKAQATYFSVLYGAGLLFEKARVGRIFLCGQPYAGKTRLRASMMGTTEKRSRVLKQVRELQRLKRTKGIDVELLRDDQEMQITIWDFGGQEIFRALQSLLLPVITQACVFVVVFSPVEDDQRHLKHDLEEAFGKELESWLRFISSSYPISGTFLPEVLVVITHKDMMRKHKLERSCDWALRKVQRFRKVYESALTLHEGLYYIDATVEKEVQPFVEEIFLLFSHILQTKTPQAPTVSCSLFSRILSLPSEKDHQPVWQVDQFYIFLASLLKSLAAGWFNPISESEREVLKAMSLYLHDVGSIFLLPYSELVVVDINWLTHRFLGQLVSQGHGFDVKKRTLLESSSPEGFVSKYILDQILMSVSSKSGRQDVSTILKVLVSLGLCYEVECSTEVKFFIPTVLEKHRTCQENLSWKTAESSDWQHVGYRLLCENRETTSLTSSVFPRFQIRFRKELMERGEANDNTYTCEHGLIRYDRNGYFIIIENDGEAGDHVDILVRFSKTKLRQVAMSYVKEQILENFRQFCASSEGCRGVTLATAIIRPDCVKELTPQRCRDDQVIVEASLKEKLREAVMQKLHQGEITWLAADNSGESLLDYEHIWPQERNTGLPKCPQRAVELLEDKDVQEILEPLYQRETDRLQRLQGVWEQMEAHLKEGKKGDANVVNMDGLSITDESSFFSDRERRLVETITQNVKEEHRTTRCHVQMGMKGLHQHLEEVHVSLSQQLLGLCTLQKEIRSTLLALVTKTDDMMGCFARLVDATMPRRPFITVSDVGVCEKIKGKLQAGRPVRLHFMCESYLEPHVVDQQEGLKLIIGDKNREWLRRIIGSSLKVFWFLLKAGLQIGLAAGNVLPDLVDSSLGSISGLVLADLTLEKLGELESLPVIEQTEMTEEVWMFLKDELTKISIPRSFNLHLVKYNPGIVEVDKSYAWLCEKCIAKGTKKVLKLVK